MAHIQMIRAGYSAAEARQATQGASFEKEDGEVLTPDEIVDLKAGSEDFRKNAENLFNYEKAHLLDLKSQGWDTSIRKEREGFGPAREYDHLVVGFTAEETRYYRDNADAQAKLMDAARAMTKTEAGQKSALITAPHMDTANGHMHIMMHRHPVDVGNQKIGVGDDLSKRSNASAFLDRFNDEMEKRGLQRMNDFRLQDGSGLMHDVSKAEAKESVADMIRESGGVAARVEHDLVSMQAGVERESLVRLETSARVDAERIEVEIQRLRDAQQSAVERVTLAQQAQAALAERDNLKGTIEQQAGQIGEQQAAIAERDTQIGNLGAQMEKQGQQLEEVGQRALAQSIKLEEMGEKVENLTGELAEVTGELAEVTGELEEVTGKSKALGEELGSARNTIAHQEQEIASLTTDRERLTGELADTRALVAEQRSMLEDMRGMMAEQRQQIEAQRAQITEQQGLIAQTTQQIEGLRTEGARLAEQVEGQGVEIAAHREALTATAEIATVQTDRMAELTPTEASRVDARLAISAIKDLQDTAKNRGLSPNARAAAMSEATGIMVEMFDKTRERTEVALAERKIRDQLGFEPAGLDEERSTKLGELPGGVEVHKSHDGKALVAINKEGKVVDYAGDKESAQSLAKDVLQQKSEQKQDKPRER